MSLLCGAFVCLFYLSSSSGLVDNPIVGSAIKYLDGEWSLSNSQHTIKANVPGKKPTSISTNRSGDIITDLYKASLVGDPIYGTNWLDYSKTWGGSQWNYVTQFTLDQSFSSASEVYLTFDGIKMGATISFNGQTLGVANDQFVRFSFPVKRFLRQSNLLIVSFGANFGRNIDVQGRFMACTGGWDWVWF
jgi:beta-galactosidase/beta-glucuronidase